MQSELSVHIYVICNIENNIRICCSIDLKCYYDYFYRLVRLVLKGCFFYGVLHMHLSCAVRSRV